MWLTTGMLESRPDKVSVINSTTGALRIEFRFPSYFNDEAPEAFEQYAQTDGVTDEYIDQIVGSGILPAADESFLSVFNTIVGSFRFGSRD